MRNKKMWTENDWHEHKNKIAAIHMRMLRDSQKSRTKSRSLEVILKYLKLYCKHTSIVGFKYLAEPQNAWWERILWILGNGVAIASLLFIVCTSYQEFVASPILTSMDSDSFHTTDLDFPGICICSINRISRQAALKFSNEIQNSNVTDLPFDEIFALVSQLGNQYSSEFSMDEDRNEEIDQLLRIYYKGDYDITEIMKNLTPQCSSMLLICKLYGKIRNCSELFEFRKSQDGFCCTFNYAREKDDIPELYGPLEHSEVYKINDLGIQRGLSVVMEPFLDDYLYPILPIQGWKVLVFSPLDFPDTTSGAVDEILAMSRAETHIDLTVSDFYTTKTVASFPVKKRGCLFEYELSPEDSGTEYSYSDCIVDCKTHDIQRICGCIPFVYPRRGKHYYSWRVCNNADLGCLANYKTKWWNVIPYENDKEKTILDKSWALQCHRCYPACEDLSYDPRTWKSFMTPGRYMTTLLWNFTVVDHGILHVYFSNYGSLRLKQDVVSYWYELMSDIGGVCGVFIGFSLISVVEFLYFVVLAIHDVIFKRSVVEDDRRENDGRKNAGTRLIQSVHTIHWNELMPRPSQMAATYDHFSKKKARY